MAGISGSVMVTHDLPGQTFADGKVMLGSDGKVRLKDGNPDKDCCVCGCTYGPCTPNCTDLRPIYYTVALSGLSGCTSCFYDAVDNYYARLDTTSLNITTGIKSDLDVQACGAWDNDSSDVGCVDPNAIITTYYQGSSCGTLVTESGLDWLIFLTSTPTLWTLQIKAVHNFLFYGTLARANPYCYTNFTISNALTTCGAHEVGIDPFGVTFATGGTATISPCCSDMPNFPDCGFLAGEDQTEASYEEPIYWVVPTARKR